MDGNFAWWVQPVSATPDHVQDSQIQTTVSLHYPVAPSGPSAPNRYLHDMPQAGHEEFCHGGAIRPQPAGTGV